MTWNNGEAALFLTYLQWDGCGQREVIYGILKNSMHMMKKFAWVSRFFFLHKNYPIFYSPCLWPPSSLDLYEYYSHPTWLR